MGFLRSSEDVNETVDKDGRYILLRFSGQEWLVDPFRIPMVDISLFWNVFSKEAKTRNIIQVFGISGTVTRGKLCYRHIQVLTSILWLHMKVQRVVTFREQ